MKVKNISVESAKIFFPTDSNWQQLGETRLKNKAGTSAGNIDMVLAALDDNDKVEDFGAMEVQSVYTSGGGLRECFKAYMADTSKGAEFEFGKAIKPDYGSSNRKRLLPQLFSKGFILHTWQKKQAIIIDENFYERLPEFTEVEESKADVVWLIYTLPYNDKDNRYHLL